MDNENTVKCDQCDFVCENDEALKAHKHDDENKITEIKLEVFGIVDFGNDVFEARKVIMEKLNEQNEVEQVLKAYVNKNETFMDINNVIWNSVDIVLSTKKAANLWENKKFSFLFFVGNIPNISRRNK